MSLATAAGPTSSDSGNRPRSLTCSRPTRSTASSQRSATPLSVRARHLVPASLLRAVLTRVVCSLPAPPNLFGIFYVGFCLGTTISKKKSAWKYGYPIWLGVSPDYQGAGIGLALYQNFQERAVADGARMIFIDTQADSPAVHFWRRQGFGHSQAHVFMSKTISGHAVRGQQQPGLVSPRGDGDSSVLGRDTEDMAHRRFHAFHTPDRSPPPSDTAAGASSNVATGTAVGHTRRRPRRTPAAAARPESLSPAALVATQAPPLESHTVRARHRTRPDRM